MLKKLMKYDLIWINKILVIYYALGIFFAVASRLLDSVQNSVFFSVLGKICSGTTIAMIINAVVNGIIRSWVRFNNNIYKDESYLTHTLPVTKHEIYLSKVLSAIITIFIAVLLAVICYYIAFMKVAPNEKYSLRNFFDMFLNLNNPYTILRYLVFLTLFLEIIIFVLVGYFGVIMGNRHNNKKLLKTFIYGFVGYIICSIIVLGAILIAGIFDIEIRLFLFDKNTLYREYVDNSYWILVRIIIICVISYLIEIIGIYLLNYRYFKKGVNVD